MRQSFKPLSALAVIFTALAVIFACWSRGMFIPRWVIWQEKQVQLDTCFLDLKDRRLSLTDESAVLWKTPPEWFVSDVQVSDFDLDGKPEVLFVLWRRGNYGASHPFWEEPDRFSFYQHLYIFEFTGSTLQRQWMSSALLPQFKDWSLCNDRLYVTDPAGENSVWQWDGFGVKRTDYTPLPQSSVSLQEPQKTVPDLSNQTGNGFVFLSDNHSASSSGNSLRTCALTSWER